MSVQKDLGAQSCNLHFLEKWGCLRQCNRDWSTLSVFENDVRRGAVYLFATEGKRRSIANKYTATDGTVWDYCGHSVAMTDDALVVEADGQNNSTGAHLI